MTSMRLSFNLEKFDETMGLRFEDGRIRIFVTDDTEWEGTPDEFYQLLADSGKLCKPEEVK